MNHSYLSSHSAKGGILHIGDVSTVELAKTYGTPLYVTDETCIRTNYRKLANAFKETTRIYYAAKANSNISILKILLDEGSYIDASSPGEIFLAINAGFPNSKIMYTGTSVSGEELQYVVKKGIQVNIDSINEMVNLLKLIKPKFISVRVNPGIGAGHHAHVITGGEASKFGLWGKDVEKVYRKAFEAGVKQFGIHMHIGSGIMESDPYIQALDNLMNIASRIHEKIGINFDLIDIGGGFGVPYKPDDKPIDINKFADRILGKYREYLRKEKLGTPILGIEPGRYVVCNSTVLLTRVTSLKKTSQKIYAGVDAGFNVLIRPAMYDAYHHIISAEKLDEPLSEVYDIAGPLCESGDLLGKESPLPKIDDGDLLAVLDVGAYGYSMASQYNARPRPAEVLVRQGKHELIRDRELFEDLLENQRIPTWLK